MPAKHPTSKPAKKHSDLTVMLVPRSGSVRSFVITPSLRNKLQGFLICLLLFIVGFGMRHTWAVAGAREAEALRAVTQEQKQKIDQLSTELDSMRTDIQRVRDLEQRVRDLLQSERPLLEKGLRQPIEGPNGILSQTLASRAADRDLRIMGEATEAKASAEEPADVILKKEQIVADMGPLLAEMTSLEGGLEKKITDLRALPTFFPCNGTITSLYGGRKNPTGAGGEYHTGIDIAAPYGSSVFAAGDGRITTAGYEKGYGLVVTVSHINGITSRYCHLSRIDVAVGETVKRGDRVGRVGLSGLTTGPHLHFEVHKNGKLVDPMTFLK